MARAPRAVWAERLRQWDESGLGASEFAARIGVNANTLSNWRFKLRAEERRSAPRVAPTKPTASPPISLVEVTSVSLAETRYELVLGGGRSVLVPSSFEASTLRRLLDVLEGR